ncbi:MAG: hypothetical protein WCZ19_01250 [Acholeplasma sp.]
MKELIGLKVKVTFFDSMGFQSLVGYVMDVVDGFIVIQGLTKLNGVMYINLTKVKMINIMNEENNEA